MGAVAGVVGDEETGSGSAALREFFLIRPRGPADRLGFDTERVRLDGLDFDEELGELMLV